MTDENNQESLPKIVSEVFTYLKRKENIFNQESLIK